VPADLDQPVPEEVLIGNLLDLYRNNMQMELNERKRLAAAMARNTAIKRGRLLAIHEMRELIDQLLPVRYPSPVRLGKKYSSSMIWKRCRKQFG
jgi:DNA mismatch repair ATPase MutL